MHVSKHPIRYELNFKGKLNKALIIHRLQFTNQYRIMVSTNS